MTLYECVPVGMLMEGGLTVFDGGLIVGELWVERVNVNVEVPCGGWGRRSTVNNGRHRASMRGRSVRGAGVTEGDRVNTAARHAVGDA